MVRATLWGPEHSIWGNSVYRIHGTNDPSTIGQFVSSGCIRLLNEDIEDLYARVTEWYAGDKERLKIRAATLHDLEHGVEPTASLAAFIADTVVRAHLKTMARLNIDYQLLTWEGDILRLKFWARAFDVLKQTGAVYLQNEGKHAGCWVMKIDDPDSAPADGDEDDDPESREKVIVRSNGTVVYVGKDMAYQFWKSGLLGQD